MPWLPLTQRDSYSLKVSIALYPLPHWTDGSADSQEVTQPEPMSLSMARHRPPLPPALGFFPEPTRRPVHRVETADPTLVMTLPATHHPPSPSWLLPCLELQSCPGVRTDRLASGHGFSISVVP